MILSFIPEKKRKDFYKRLSDSEVSREMLIILCDHFESKQCSTCLIYITSVSHVLRSQHLSSLSLPGGG